MTTAVIIVILILVLSIGLFFLIRKLANASSVDSEVYNEEGVITDFNDINHNQENSVIDESTIKKSSFGTKIAMIISNIYKFINKQIQSINQLKIKYQKYQADKIKAKEQAIQEAIRLDQEAQELELKHKNNLESDLDTSHFELENNNPKATVAKNIDNDNLVSKNHNPESKATDFVEQLLADVDAIADSNTNDDISDTYYYEYMEKRYIDRIVANSKDIEAYKKLGDLYVDMRNYKDALEAFTYVLKLKPNDTMSARRVKDISNRLQKKG